MPHPHCYFPSGVTPGLSKAFCCFPPSKTTIPLSLWASDSPTLSYLRLGRGLGWEGWLV